MHQACHPDSLPAGLSPTALASIRHSGGTGRRTCRASLDGVFVSLYFASNKVHGVGSRGFLQRVHLFSPNVLYFFHGMCSLWGLRGRTPFYRRGDGGTVRVEMSHGANRALFFSGRCTCCEREQCACGGMRLKTLLECVFVKLTNLMFLLSICVYSVP